MVLAFAMVVAEHPPWSSKTSDLNTYGYAQFSAIPMRREADHCSEMVNQAMLGEPLELLTSKALWTKVRLAHDGYEGWVLTAQLLAIDQLTYRALIEQTQELVADGINLLEHESPEKTRVVAAGALLPNYNPSTGQLSLGQDTFQFEGLLSNRETTRDNVLMHAYTFLHAPYLWGGRTVMGIDCSGLSQMAYRLSGITLLRDASQQATQGETVDFLTEAQPGDLVFFDNDQGAITHVGIFLRQDHILHASGSVRIDGLDQTGIYNADTGKHSHKLRLIKRYF